MMLDIDLRLFAKDVLYVSPEPRDSGWSFFNVYSLLDFKNIYNVYYENENVRSIPAFIIRKTKRFSIPERAVQYLKTKRTAETPPIRL